MTQRQITLTQGQQDALNDKLFDAIDSRKYTDMRQALEDGAQASVWKAAGTLRKAVDSFRNGGGGAVQLLLASGAGDAQTTEGMKDIKSALRSARNQGFPHIVKLLEDAEKGIRPDPALLSQPLDLPVVTIAREVELTQIERDALTDAMFAAITTMDYDEVKRLLEDGAEANALDVHTGNGALLIAVMQADFNNKPDSDLNDMVTLLLAAGARQELIDAYDQADNTSGYRQSAAVLNSAIHGKFPDASAIGLDLPVVTIGAPALTQEELDHDLRVGAGNGDIPRMLEAYVGGAKLDAPNASGDTALMCGILDKQVEAVTLLLALGADTSLTNSDGETAEQLTRHFRIYMQGSKGDEIYDLVAETDAGKRPNLSAVLASMNLEPALESAVLEEYSNRLKATKLPDAQRPEDMAKKGQQEKLAHADTLPPPPTEVIPEPEPEKPKTLQQRQHERLKQDLERSLKGRYTVDDHSSPTVFNPRSRLR